MGAPVSHKGQKQEEESFKKACFSTKTPLVRAYSRFIQYIMSRQ